MRRRARWTLNALAALSLLMCTATVVAWAWSYFAPGAGTFTLRGNPTHWSLSRGVVTLNNDPAVARDFAVLVQDVNACIAASSARISLTGGCRIATTMGPESDWQATKATFLTALRSSEEYRQMPTADRGRWLADQEARLDAAIAPERNALETHRQEAAARAAALAAEIARADAASDRAQSRFSQHQAVAAQPWSHQLPLRYVSVALAVLCLPAFCVRRRPIAGTCRSCGYDLTGNVSGVCPECGTQIPKSSAEFSN